MGGFPFCVIIAILKIKLFEMDSADMENSFIPFASGFFSCNGCSEDDSEAFMMLCKTVPGKLVKRSLLYWKVNFKCVLSVCVQNISVSIFNDFYGTLFISNHGICNSLQDQMKYLYMHMRIMLKIFALMSITEENSSGKRMKIYDE